MTVTPSRRGGESKDFGAEPLRPDFVVRDRKPVQEERRCKGTTERMLLHVLAERNRPGCCGRLPRDLRATAVQHLGPDTLATRHQLAHWLSGATNIAASLRHHPARTERPITLLLTS